MHPPKDYKAVDDSMHASTHTFIQFKMCNALVCFTPLKERCTRVLHK